MGNKGCSDEVAPTALKGDCFNCGALGHNQCPHSKKEPSESCPQCKKSETLVEGMFPASKGTGSSQTHDGPVLGGLKGPGVLGGSLRKTSLDYGRIPGDSRHSR